MLGIREADTCVREARLRNAEVPKDPERTALRAIRAPYARTMMPDCTVRAKLEPQAQPHTLTPDEQIRLDCGITCYLPVDTTMLYLMLHPKPEQPQCLFHAHLRVPNVKATKCPVRERVHEAVHLPLLVTQK